MVTFLGKSLKRSRICLLLRAARYQLSVPSVNGSTHHCSTLPGVVVRLAGWCLIHCSTLLMSHVNAQSTVCCLYRRFKSSITRRVWVWTISSFYQLSVMSKSTSLPQSYRYRSCVATLRVVCRRRSVCWCLAVSSLYCPVLSTPPVLPSHGIKFSLLTWTCADNS